MPSRHLCASPTCREMTKHVLCWSCWRAAPLGVHRMSDDQVREWAVSSHKAPVLTKPPARPFNETPEKDPT
jgi:hypothetical protein